MRYKKNTVFLVLFLLVIVGAIFVASLYKSKNPSLLDLSKYFTQLQPQQIQLISIESQQSNLRVKLSNPEYIERILQELDFWSGEKKIYETKSRIYADITRLNIVITATPQQFNQVVDPRQNPPFVYQSAGLEHDFSNQALTLYIHLDPKFVATASEEDLGVVFSKMTLQRLYGVKKEIGNQEDVVFVEQHTESFIQVTKK